jgi:tetratricopeptide (TPR) repeat protein
LKNQTQIEPSAETENNSNSSFQDVAQPPQGLPFSFGAAGITVLWCFFHGRGGLAVICLIWNVLSILLSRTFGDIVSVLITIIGWTITVIMGLKGSRIAWEDRRCNSVQGLKQHERGWTIAGGLLIIISAILTVAGLVSLIGSVKQPDSVQDNYKWGIQALTEQKYDLASKFFEKAVELDPAFEAARMHLATTYYSQFIPGSSDPVRGQMASKAIEEFKKVVLRAQDPAKPNKNAMFSIASIYYRIHKPNESRDWCKRLLKSNPQIKEAYVLIEIIDFDDVLEKTGIAGENVKFLKPAERLEIQAIIDEGLAYSDKGLQVSPDFLDALAYKAFLLMEKAQLENNAKIKADLENQVTLTFQKVSLLSSKDKQVEAKKPVHADFDLTGPLLEYLNQLPPLPPPPPDPSSSKPRALN